MKDKVIDILSKIGFKYKTVKDGVYIFQYRNLNVVYRVYEDDPRFLRMGMPIDRNRRISNMYEIANEMNLRLKYIKTCVYADNIWCFFEREIQDDDDMEQLINKVVIRMQEALTFYLDLINCSIKSAGEAS